MSFFIVLMGSRFALRKAFRLVANYKKMRTHFVEHRHVRSVERFYFRIQMNDEMQGDFS